MGIQAFGVRVKHLATKFELRASDCADQKVVMIVDGPGLAYHVYYKLLDARTNGSVTVEYADCVDGTVRWLDEMQEYGFSVDAILFDGALPAAKLHTRIARLQGNIDSLRRHLQSADARRHLPLGRAKSDVPAPPFLVPAVVEGLRQRPAFRDLTFVVPGEADVFCAAAAQQQSDECAAVVVFSDDADLFVYAVPENTRIVPFRDLVERMTDGERVLHGEEYRPCEILQRFGLGHADMVKPAYWMQRDRQISFQGAVVACASIQSLDVEFSAFASQFRVRDERGVLQSLREQTKPSSGSSMYDSRISELILQASSGQGIGCENQLCIFPPYLVDDLARTTAWTANANIRRIAYSILLQHHRPHADAMTIHEYRRKEFAISPTHVHTLARSELPDQMSELAACLEQQLAWCTQDGAVTSVEMWQLLVIQYTMQHCHLARKRLPPPSDILPLIHVSTQVPWPTIHLSAQYHATYYSFRICKQILDHTTLRASPPPSHTHIQLRNLLATLPDIATFFTPNRTMTAPQKSRWHDLLLSLEAGLLSPAPHDDEKSRNPPVRDKHRAKRNVEQKPPSSVSRSRTAKTAKWASKNPFALLDET